MGAPTCIMGTQAMLCERAWIIASLDLSHFHQFCRALHPRNVNYGRILPSSTTITPNPLVKTPFAKIHKAVPCCLHSIWLLRIRREVITAWTSLAGITIVAPSILGAPHILGERTREHGPAV